MCFNEAVQLFFLTKQKKAAAYNYENRYFESSLKFFLFYINTGNHSGTEVNLVLLGMAGTGKSASGNTILGEKEFISKASSCPVTTDCQEAKTVIGGRRVRVIDTPDIFDDERKSSIKEHVKKCQELCRSGPCVYLLVIQVSRFTDGERDILKKLETAFGSKVTEQTIILFTRGKDLQQGEMSFKEFLHQCQPDLKKIVEKCRGRCVVFENRASGSDQVEKRMQIVDRMLKEKETAERQKNVYVSGQAHKGQGQNGLGLNFSSF
ncbi:GTPase IMAP family member 2-like [Perca fluviatilis]|uniref:GTPase IMAP family member 2-like n=1 Tax=Perca fluviatilis TaxID=8168 RepID=UPI0019627A8D|nr:GTPase IMAP family member 2-like [Perca fluviatilis]